MLFKNIAILDENLELREGVNVGVCRGKICYIGEEMPAENLDFMTDGEIVDGGRLLLMSGFYNTHAHSAMTLMRGYGEGLSLQDWLNKRVFPFEDKLDGNAVYWGTMVAIAESLASGIVSSSDMYYFCPDVARAVTDSRTKMNISRAVTHFDDSDPKKSERFMEMKRFIEDYNLTNEGKIIAEASLHAEYTSNPAAAEAVGECALELGAGLQVHLSETKAEHEACKERHGKTPARYFFDLGMLRPRTVAAHCVWLEGEDFDILAESGTHVASCPVSNMKLASGIADVPEMLRRGVAVTIGTDSVASNNSLNFFEEMKIFMLGSKIKSGDPRGISPSEVLYMATAGGAKAQGRENCGSLKVGNRADLIAIDTRMVNLQPMHDVKTSLVYSAGPENIVLTMVDGEILYERGEFKSIDVEKAMFEAKNATERILGML